ncbi:MAG TPA: hypothetical protein VFT51_00045, partial [Bacillales bacterium]|nr:hypothetical protein [Bacillales bacterium]
DRNFLLRGKGESETLTDDRNSFLRRKGESETLTDDRKSYFEVFWSSAALNSYRNLLLDANTVTIKARKCPKGQRRGGFGHRSGGTVPERPTSRRFRSPKWRNSARKANVEEVSVAEVAQKVTEPRSKPARRGKNGHNPAVT